MEKKEEVVKNVEAPAKPETKRQDAVEGELTFADLTYIVGGISISPIVNGRIGSNLKTRFGRIV